MCRIPPSLDLRSVNHGDRTAGVFAQSTALTTDGTISIVPTPGHANGHQSVLISDEGRSVCLVGDAAFSQRQAVDGDIGGIVENHRAATTSAQLLKAQLTQFQTVLLPTHDTENASRLRAL
jgi:N-acyl homoserine lactone hydrolase